MSVITGSANTQASSPGASAASRAGMLGDEALLFLGK
jgi:hypothetical protein